MDIATAKNCKKQAEDEIQETLARFMMRTGLVPERVTYELIDVTTIGDQESTYRISKVRVKVEFA